MDEREPPARKSLHRKELRMIAIAEQSRTPDAGRTSYYAPLIRETLARIGRLGAADVRWLEGWLRSAHGCLDALSASEFTAEVALALECCAACTSTQNEEMARSFGL
jgi:hypothetical protein